ncbi:bifunctional DedA family/phosphatase PAP2 family protein [Marinobacter sp.]|uniref:bifunctional DedA family/phosphatase PAP2 family protein n=1 Tax=Marinobacter sp. TaxID=50741 RepID=UPI00384D7374
MVPEWLEGISQWLSLNPGWLAVALALVAFAESLAVVGLVVPGVAILFAIALLAGQSGMPLMQVLVWTALGAVVGDNVSFWLGRRFQGRLHSIWPFSRYPSMLDRGEVFFRQHGGKSIVIGRFVGPIRPVIPMVAGTFAMDGRRFLVFNLASALAWAPFYILPGFLVGSTLAMDIDLPRYFYPILAVSIFLLVMSWLLFVRVQLGLDSGSRFYLRVQSWMVGDDVTHGVWHGLSSHRPGQPGEFPLASLTLALAGTALFLIWSSLTLATGMLESLDSYVLGFFLTLRHPLFDPPALVMTLMGDPEFLAFTASVAIGTLAFRGYYAAAIHVGMAMLVTGVTVTLMKSGFDMPRPDAVLRPPDSGSYPSGHVAGSAIILGLAASFVARESGSRKRWRVYLAFGVPLLLMAISRLYLGVHWQSDVVGGLLLGLAICGFTRVSYSRYDQTPLSLDAFSILALVLWVAMAIMYTVLSWPEALVIYAPTASG